MSTDWSELEFIQKVQDNIGAVACFLNQFGQFTSQI